MEPIKWTLTSFEQLLAEELYAVLQLRAEVFVVEQNCPYLDPDGKDRQALHLMGYVGGKLAAYCRLLPPGNSYVEASIGRVVCSPAFRGQALGIRLMKEAIRLSLEKFEVADIRISAQYYLLDFYRRLGFVQVGDVYLEDSIEHIEMHYKRSF